VSNIGEHGAEGEVGQHARKVSQALNKLGRRSARVGEEPVKAMRLAFKRLKLHAAGKGLSTAQRKQLAAKMLERRLSAYAAHLQRSSAARIRSKRAKGEEIESQMPVRRAQKSVLGQAAVGPSEWRQSDDTTSSECGAASSVSSLPTSSKPGASPATSEPPSPRNSPRPQAWLTPLPPQKRPNRLEATQGGVQPMMGQRPRSTSLRPRRRVQKFAPESGVVRVDCGLSTELAAGCARTGPCGERSVPDELSRLSRPTSAPSPTDSVGQRDVLQVEREALPKISARRNSVSSHASASLGAPLAVRPRCFSETL